jgi:hypothetical protein
MTERYDESTQTLWIHSNATGDDLIPNEEIQQWIDALGGGQTPDGRPLQHVNYVFADADAAEYNHQPLKFARVGTFVGDLEDNEPYDADDGVSFDTKADFGID